MVSTFDLNFSERTADSAEEIILSINNISKKFCRDFKRSLFYGIQDIASEVVGFRTSNEKLRKEEFWALKDISFSLRKGETIGLVGRNGSGKSTLLRIISGLIKPDTGNVEVRGRVAPLIALGAGFNPVLTGRENIYSNMSILGLTKDQIDKIFDAVVEFSEIGNAIDAPVQSYSSGMAARLGFACAIHTEPDILVIDEVLAVGDVQFRTKCYRKLGEIRKKGVSFILVSHNPNSILSLCESAVYLQSGIVKEIGDTPKVMRIYEADALNLDTEEILEELVLPPKSKEESLGIDITSVSFKDEKGNKLRTLHSSELARLCVGCKSHQYFDDINLAVTIKGQASEGDTILGLCNSHEQIKLEMLPGHNMIELVMPYVGLAPGPYFINLNIRQGSMMLMDSVSGFNFNVESNLPMFKCKFYQPCDWKVYNIKD